MDVVVTPTGSAGTSWSLKDRLGRPLGAIELSGLATGFEIKPELSGGLRAVPTFHATLNDAMTAIARHMQGECTLDSQDWD
ncbi:hypothetical protein ACU4GR_33540 (plasmid) [Methylobacterium oryzae CBMB20]|jgi:hypothetical protein|uniref:hypothetical protein n=1 Tax=Methylobacterium sp. UNCCL125 TaxID=1502759 RepID=UPI0008E8569B|nr:hypothetical protein [Methylobacterium sp. UNCCL125]SFV13014.1 hypothetical protein SAMN02799643_05810 [Methylobacterium sp. UNCCL125]